MKIEQMTIDEELKVRNIFTVLSSYRFPLIKEKETQQEIESRFLKHGINYIREYRLDADNIPDFFIDGIVIEIKIKGSAKKIFKQCERYCQFESVKCLVIVTNRSMGFPKQINGKLCYVINLGKAWL